MPGTIVYGRHVVVDSERVIPSGALYLEGPTIVDVGTYGEMPSRHKAERTLGSADAPVIPGLANAHGHGKGLTDFQRGQLDDTLETWKWRSFPPVDPYLDTLWGCLQLLESGVTTTMHNHGLMRPDAWAEEFAEVLRAYGDAGLRVALAPALSTENVFTYGEDEAFLAAVPGEVREAGERILQRVGLFGEKQYFAAVHALHA